MAKNNFKKWPKLSVFEHTFRKLFFCQNHLPMLLVAAHIGQRVVAVDIDDVEFRIARTDVHLVEEIAEFFVVHLLAVAPDDQRLQSVAAGITVKDRLIYYSQLILPFYMSFLLTEV